MNKHNLILALALSLTTAAQAVELGHSNGRSSGYSAAMPSGSRLSVVAPTRIPTQINSSTCSKLNTGLCSVLVLNDTVQALSASEREARRQEALRNVARTNRNRDLNMSNLRGCKLIVQGPASCYGAGDGFGSRKGRMTTYVGTRFNPRDMTAAFNSDAHMGKIIVVRNPETNVARAVTVTDTGSFGKKYGRVIDLSAGAVEEFGLRCSPTSGSQKKVELYSCPGT
jgi:rare lipoprotein A (peptidoglycan hydrolase)